MINNNLHVGIGTEAFPPTIDGVSIVAKCYADKINKDLGKATIIVPENSNKKDYLYPYEIYRYMRLFEFGEGYTVGWPFKKQFALDIIDKNFDVLHSHCPIATSYFFRRINRIKRIPQILTYHTKYEYDIDSRVPSYAIKKRAYGFIYNNIASADEVWVTSKGTVESLRKFGYEGDYVIMPNGCDLPKFEATPDQKMIMRRKHNIPNDVPLFIFSGRLMWYKNIKTILEACRILNQKHFDYRIIFVGVGPEENQIRKLCSKLQLDGKVIFTGLITDRREMQYYYSAADVQVFPSLFDTNGLVVREAAASGTPSILVEGSCAAENISDEQTGFICKNDCLDLANKMIYTVQNKKLIETVGNNARNDIYISWDEAVTKAYERYQIVIDNFHSKPHNSYKY